MTTEQLQYLLEISRNPSLNSASQKLHITPQALSISIKKLENELGFPLLERSYKGISLNNDGLWLAGEAEKFLKRISDRQALHSISNAAHISGELPLYFSYSGISDNVFSKVICELYTKVPDLKITLQEYSKENIIKMVQNGQIETGFIYRTTSDDTFFDQLPDDIVFQPLFSGRSVLLTGPDNELAKMESITLKKLAKYPLISYTPLTRGKGEETLFRNLYNSPTEVLIETNFSMFKEKIMHNIANSLAVFFETEEQPTNYFEGVKVVEIRNNIKTYLGFIKKKDATLPPQATFFLNELSRQIGSSSKNF